MSEYILVEGGVLSARLLKKPCNSLDGAFEDLAQIYSFPICHNPTGYFSLYPVSISSDVIRLRTSLDAVRRKMRLYADILDAGPDAICEVDEKYKNSLTDWWDRAEYKFSNSAFGITMATVDDLIADVWQDIYAGTEEITDIIVAKADYGYDVVIAKVLQIASDLNTSYNEHGVVYDWVEYGKCTVKAGMGIYKIVKGTLSLALGGNPLGAVDIVSGMDKLNNAAADATYISCDAYEQVGTTNWLKDTLSEKGEDLGRYLGNPEAGEFLGESIYLGFKAVDLLNDADELLKEYGKIDTIITNSTGYSFCWGWTSFDDVLDGSGLKTIWGAIKSTKDILEDAWDWGEIINEVGFTPRKLGG